MRIFLSHAQSDREFAGRIARDLEGAGHEVWSDKEVLPGDNWASALGKALDSADVLVALVSPDAIKSAFVTKEWEYALGQERFAGRVFPIEVKPTRKAPWILERLQVIRAASVNEASRELLAALPSPGRHPKSRKRAAASR